MILLKRSDRIGNRRDPEKGRTAMNENNVIVRDFERPSAELVERFKGIPVANLDDCMERRAAVHSSIKPVGYKGPMVGTAFTVRVPEGDNLMLHAAMEYMKPGDVVVLDAGGYTERAIFGELMAAYMKNRGVLGVVVDGAIRDSESLAEIEGFQVYARSATPDGPFKNGPGAVNVPITFSGKTVFPGDIVTADRDGLLFIRPENAEALLEAVHKVEVMEAGIMKLIVEKDEYERPWVKKKLEEIGTEIL